MTLVLTTAATLLSIAPLPVAAGDPVPRGLMAPDTAAAAAPPTATPPIVLTLPETPPPAEPVPPPPAGPPPTLAAPIDPDDAGADAIVVVAPRADPSSDPIAAVNREAFQATVAVDDAVFGPAARTYKQVVPSPLRRGLRNFLYNLREPVVFVNFLLQHKLGKAAETLGRFATNSTLGVAGVFDVAKRRPFRLPRRRNGFGNTLGFYGVGPGPFLYLPLIGPTTVRDLLGTGVDGLVLPALLGSRVTDPEIALPLIVLRSLDHRAQVDERLGALRADGEAYANTRAFYLQQRAAEIEALHGRPAPRPTVPPTPAPTPETTTPAPLPQ